MLLKINNETLCKKAMHTKIVRGAIKLLEKKKTLKC